MTERVLIVGCGDTGRRVARRYCELGADVTGVVRSQASAERVATLGARPLIFDLDESPFAGEIPDAGYDFIFYFAPPPRQGDSDPRLDAFLQALGDRLPRRLVYISTSGVYGDCDGAWVDETRPVNPQTGRARRRVAAEQALTVWSGNWVILRAPGIYGPGRLPLDKLRAGEPVLRDADCSWSNRIHIDDLATCAMRATRHGPDREIYNACDGSPTRMADYYNRIAQFIGVAPPPQIDWATAAREFSEMRLSFLRESRRLDNRRLLSQLELQLAYPDIEAGLAASLDGY